MSLFDKFDLESLIEKAMEHIDMESLAREVMGRLVLKDLELFLVVRKFQGSDEADFVGVTYGEEAGAKLAKEEGSDHHPCTLLRIDMGKLTTMAENAGIAEEVYVHEIT